MHNPYDFRVAKKNEKIVSSIEDHNAGYPNQKNRGRYYRYEVTYVNGDTFGANSKSAIESDIAFNGKYEAETILKEAAENAAEETAKWAEYLASQPKAVDEEAVHQEIELEEAVEADDRKANQTVEEIIEAIADSIIELYNDVKASDYAPNGMQIAFDDPDDYDLNKYQLILETESLRNKMFEKLKLNIEDDFHFHVDNGILVKMCILLDEKSQLHKADMLNDLESVHKYQAESVILSMLAHVGFIFSASGETTALSEAFELVKELTEKIEAFKEKMSKETTKLEKQAIGGFIEEFLENQPKEVINDLKRRFNL